MLLSRPRIAALVISLPLLLVCGCGMQSSPSAGPGGVGVRGKVHGGQQPVSGATVQLYAVGTTGDGSAATPLLSPAVTTGADGSFNITGLYTCPGGAYVYLVATGGDPGGVGANPSLAMMTALGPCSALSSSTYIAVNELTTVAAVTALAPFMSGYGAVGSGSGDAGSLAAAFELANELVNTATGTAPGSGVPVGMSVPTDALNTLADIVAACVNSTGGTAGNSSMCGRLFSYTTPGGQPSPADTIAALLNLAKDPTMSTDALFGLLGPDAPFQPELAMTPPDFRVRLTPSSPSGYVLQFDQLSLTFAATAVSESSAAETVTITNSGGSAVTLTGISITGTNAGDFAQTNACGGTLASHDSCTVEVTMTPSATGARSAYLAVASSSPDSPQYVALAGTGGTGSGVVLLGSRSLYTYPGLTRDVTLKNAGTGTLTLSSIATVTGSYSVGSDCPGSLAAGAMCTLAITNRGPSNGALQAGTFVATPATTAFPGPVDAVTVTSSAATGTDEVLLNDGYLSMSFANVSVTPANVAFPQVVVGQSGTAVVTIRGPLPEFVGSSRFLASTSGSDAGDFTLSTNDCQGLVASQSCSFTVTFRPSAAGTRTAKLVLDGFGGYVPLMGAGVSSVPAQVTLTPALTFHNKLSGTQDVTLSNGSGSAVTISGVTVSSGFTQTNTCGGTLGAGASCTVHVGSTLVTEGGVQGLLTVTGGFGTVQSALASTVDPVLQFGSAQVGQMTAVQPSFNSVGYEYNAIPGRDFGIPFTPTLSGGNVSVGEFAVQGCTSYQNQTCNAMVTGTPGDTGLRYATINFAFGDLNFGGYSLNFLAEMTGVGTGANLTFDSDAFLVSQPGSSTTQQIQVTNNGTTTLGLASAVVSGPDAARFSAGLGCATLAPGHSCDLAVTFSPTAHVLSTAIVTVTDTGSGASFALPLRGLGYYAAATVTPGSLSFPPTTLNTDSAPMSFTVAVPSGGGVTAWLKGGSPYRLTKSSCAAGETPCLITAVFHPVGSNGSPNVVLDSVQIEGTSALGPPTPSYQLSGYAGAPTAGLSPGSLTFDDRAAGTTSLPQNVTLSNTGDGYLQNVSVSITGTDASQFSLTNGCGTLAPSGSCTISVAFAPTTAGSKSASLVVTSNDVHSPQTVGLSGMAH